MAKRSEKSEPLPNVMFVRWPRKKGRIDPKSVADEVDDFYDNSPKRSIESQIESCARAFHEVLDPHAHSEPTDTRSIYPIWAGDAAPSLDYVYLEVDAPQPPILAAEGLLAIYRLQKSIAAGSMDAIVGEASMMGWYDCAMKAAAFEPEVLRNSKRDAGLEESNRKRRADQPVRWLQEKEEAQCAVSDARKRFPHLGQTKIIDKAAESLRVSSSTVRRRLTRV